MPSVDGEVFIQELERQLSVGCNFDDVEEFYRLYSEYGRYHGFSVRRGNQRYFTGNKIIRKKDFMCSCEGEYDEKRSDDKLLAYKKQRNRHCCKAIIRVSRNKDCPWSVIKFVKEHTHELVSPDQGFLLRSARKLDAILEALHSSGIRISSAFRFMEKQAGGPEHVGFTKKDTYNHMDKAKAFSRVPNGDAMALTNFFLENSNREQYFYWKAQMDDDGRLMNFFFRDSRSLSDLEMFGDVISVDTTYLTNKYDLIVAPFVGINHHRKNILLGVGFLSNETTSSFEWLFDTFLDSMYGKQPEMISTYSLEDHRWLANMYSLRRRWASVFTQDRFSAGLLATSRSEATNKVVKDICASTNSLFEFVQCFEQVKKNWRNTERQEDALNIGVPGQYVNHNLQLMKAAKKLTRAAFKVFESEVAHSLNVVTISVPPDPCADVLVFKVANARRRTFDEIHQTSAQPSSASLSGLTFLNRMMRFTFEIANDSKDNDECRALCLKAMAALKTVVDNKVHGRLPKLPSYSKAPSSTPVHFFDPRPSIRRTKNAADRPPTSHWSARKTKKPRTTKSKTNSAPFNDVASSPLNTPFKESAGNNADLGVEQKDQNGKDYISSQKSVNLQPHNVMNIADIFRKKDT